jgi:hypothetical protein
MYFSSLFSFLKLIDVDLGCLQEWGRNFDDMPQLLSENNPGEVGERGNQGAITGTSESRAAVVLPGVSVGESGLLFADYVPHLVPQSTRSSGKRARVDDSSTRMFALKKSHPLLAVLIDNLYRQHNPKKEENIHLYTHIHVQLICFHVYQ